MVATRFASLVSLVSLVALVAGGCGPMLLPAVQRLDDQDQAIVDSSWNNMLAPADRLDRQTLLDVLIVSHLFESGVDRLELRSEKAYAGGTVVMQISFQKQDPAADRFELTLYDQQWRLLRHEVYSAADDVERTARELGNCPPDRQLTEDGEPVPEPAEVTARREAHVIRFETIRAATQPAVVPTIAEGASGEP